MKKIITILTLLMIGMLVMSCGGKEEPEFVPEPAPAPAPEPEPVVEEKPKVAPTTQIVSDVLLKEGTGYIDSVSCDTEDLHVAFTLTNPTEGPVSVKALSALQAGEGIEPLKVTLNGRTIRDLVEICGGSDVLNPGQVVECKKPFTPNDLKQKFVVRVGLDEFNKPLVNYLLVKVDVDKQRVEFKCDLPEGGLKEPAVKETTVEAPAEPAKTSTVEVEAAPETAEETEEVSDEEAVLRAADHAEHGNILVDNAGMTLYTFDNDELGKSTCFAACAQTWPPLLVETNEVATSVAGVDVITRTDGGKQVTYNDKPLYTFSGDKAVGDANGQGTGNVWWVATK